MRVRITTLHRDKFDSDDIHVLSTTICNVNITKGAFAEQGADSNKNMLLVSIATFHIVEIIQTKNMIWAL